MFRLTQGADWTKHIALLSRAAVLTAVLVFGAACAGKHQEEAASGPTITTASIVSHVPDFSDEALLADGGAMLSALSKTDLSGEKATPWQNVESGASGLITAYSQELRDGQRCLAFTTTRESFDGIGLYRGTACEDAAGILRLHELVYN